MATSEFEASPELKKLAKERLGVKVFNPHKHLDFAWGYLCGFFTMIIIVCIAMLVVFIAGKG